MSKYEKNINTVVSSGGLIIAGFIISSGISFLFKIVVARYLGSVQFGIISLGVAITSIGSIAMFGLDRGIARYLPRYNNSLEKKRVSRFVLLLGVASGIVVAASVYIFSSTLSTILNEPSGEAVFNIFSLGVPFLVLIKLTIGITRGKKLSYPKVILQNILIPVFRLLLAGAVVTTGLTTIGIAWAHTLTYIITGLIAVYFIILRTPVINSEECIKSDSKLQVSNELYLDIFKFSLPIMVVTFSNILMTSVDTVMIGFFNETRDVGIYNVVLPISRLSLIIFSAFNFVILPIISELQSENEIQRIQSLYKRVTIWILVLLFPIAVVLVGFPESVISIVFGQEYVAGAPALMILTLGFITHSVAGPNEDSLASMGKTRTIMYDSLIVLIINIILNLFLIPGFSYVGAAIATASSFALLNILFSYHLYASCNIFPTSKKSITLVLFAGMIIGSARILYLQTGGTIVITGILASISVITMFIIIIATLDLGEEEMYIINAIESRTSIDILELFRI